MYKLKKKEEENLETFMTTILYYNLSEIKYYAITSGFPGSYGVYYCYRKDILYRIY